MIVNFEFIRAKFFTYYFLDRNMQSIIYHLFNYKIIYHLFIIVIQIKFLILVRDFLFIYASLIFKLIYFVKNI